MLIDQVGTVEKPVLREDSEVVRHRVPLAAGLPTETSLQDAEPFKERKKRQKKRKRDDLLLEDLYMSKLQEEITPKAHKVVKSETTKESAEKTPGVIAAEEDAQSGSDSDQDNSSDPKKEAVREGSLPVHEVQHRQDKELLKAKATVFVGNLPTSVITSTTDYKVLKTLFSKFGKISSIRFRSIAFSELLPRKVAFLQGKFHPERDTFNAYIVFDIEKEAREALSLNGQSFLGKKHMRVDSVAHPAPHENKKCVFVGSLPFDAAEEDLWTHFSKAGPVNNVRVIRDKTTNVGKGFAYVQFEDIASVQNALLLHEKKMLSTNSNIAPRKLRVTKASSMPSKHKAEQKERDKIRDPDLKPRDKAKLGRVKNLMGSQAAAKLKVMQKELALEGERAKKADGIPGVGKKKKKKSKNGLARSKNRAGTYRKSSTTAK